MMQSKNDKPIIKEIIVVEGRDDTAAMLRAADVQTIETHGFGIRRETWELIERAYNNQGIIVFTDPDFAGNEIRRRLMEKFPKAAEAFLARNEATKDGDIGIENASPKAILEALGKAHYTEKDARSEFTFEDMYAYGLMGEAASKQRRDMLGKVLGIGYGNAGAFLHKLNKYGITRKELEEKLEKI